MTVVVLAVSGVLLVAVSVTLMARLPLRPGAYVVRRVPESHAPVLTATLTRSPRALPGRPSAGATEGPVYTITDLPVAHRAPGR